MIPEESVDSVEKSPVLKSLPSVVYNLKPTPQKEIMPVFQEKAINDAIWSVNYGSFRG